MLQDQHRSGSSGGGSTGRDGAIFILALQSLNAVKRAHEPQWECVVHPVNHEEAESALCST